MLAKRKRVRVAPAPLSGDEADREPILDDERPASAGVRSQGTVHALPCQHCNFVIVGISSHHSQVSQF